MPGALARWIEQIGHGEAPDAVMIVGSGVAGLLDAARGTGARVVLLEPDPVARAAIMRRVGIDARISILPFAVSAPGTARIYRRANFPVMSGTSATEGLLAAFPGLRAKPVEVEWRSVSDVVSLAAPSPRSRNVLVIDRPLDAGNLAAAFSDAGSLGLFGDVLLRSIAGGAGANPPLPSAVLTAQGFGVFDRNAADPLLPALWYRRLPLDAAPRAEDRGMA
jgi:hypothetical protein